MFSCKFCEICKNTFFCRTPPVAASERNFADHLPVTRFSMRKIILQKIKNFAKKIKKMAFLHFTEDIIAFRKAVIFCFTYQFWLKLAMSVSKSSEEDSCLGTLDYCFHDPYCNWIWAGIRLSRKKVLEYDVSYVFEQYLFFRIAMIPKFGNEYFSKTYKKSCISRIKMNFSLSFSPIFSKSVSTLNKMFEFKKCKVL